MNKQRYDLISELSNDAKMSLTYQDFTISEIEELIQETPLTDIDRRIAKLKYIRRFTIKEISYEVGLHPRTIQRHLPDISVAIKSTITKLYLKDD